VGVFANIGYNIDTQSSFLREFCPIECQQQVLLTDVLGITNLSFHCNVILLPNLGPISYKKYNYGMENGVMWLCE
jgi:hypothetical protein